MDYEQLSVKSEKLSKDVLGLFGKAYSEPGRDFLDPPTFNTNIKYLFLGVNPGEQENNKIRRRSDSEILLTISRELSIKYPKIKKKLIFPSYYDKLLDLLDFDKKVKIFWQHKKCFDIIRSQNQEFGIILDEIAGRADGNDSDNYISFSDLIWVKCKKQKKIVEIIEKNDKFQNSVIDFFNDQMDYYKPKNVVVINAFVSSFICQKIYGMDIKKEGHSSFFDVKRKIRYFFSSMIAGQRALDQFSFVRLKNEIRQLA